MKAVLSGDTLVLVGSAPAGKRAPELQVTLASLSAPRLGNPSKADEPFAWESREFLRRLAINKPVRFKVAYTVAAIKRSFADVVLTDGDRNLGVEMARAGWARVKGSGDGKSSVYDELVGLQGAAEAAGIGIFNADPDAVAASVRSVQWRSDNTAELLPELKAASPVDAIVEMVRDGAGLRCYLPAFQRMVNFNMAGVQCPRLNTAPRAPRAGRGGAGAAAAAPGKGADAASSSKTSEARVAQPFAEEAKAFTETRLLNQEVRLHFNGAERNNFYGIVEHPAGSIAAEILKAGLGNVADWSIVHAGATIPDLRAAERTGKASKQRIWKDYTPAAISGQRTFTGKVLEIVTAEQFVIKVDATGPRQERRIFLASVRAPRRGNSRRGEPDEPFYWAAKEFARKFVAGKTVTVHVDYERKLEPREGETGPPQVRHYGNLTVSGRGEQKNLAEALVANGYCDVVRHRAGDDRASNFDALQAAELLAKSAKKNKHSSKAKEKGVHKVTDLVGDTAKAKTFLPFLTRARGHKAIVEHVFNGGRYKLYLPGENSSIAFALSGIRVPMPARRGRKGGAGGAGGEASAGRAADPFSQEALDFARDNLLLQEVEIDVVDMDKGGTALGELRFGSGRSKQDFGLQLVRLGLAKLFLRVTDRMANGEKLREAEKAARDARLNVWENYTPPVVEEPKEEAAPDRSDKRDVVTVCDVSDGSHFHVHAESEAATRTDVEARMKALTEEVGTAAAPCEPKKGSVVAALFDDGSGPQWFRAKVLSIEGDAAAGQTYNLSFIDFGNKDAVPISRLRPLSGDLATIPALAHECVTAFLRVPGLDAEHGNEAATCFHETVFGRRVLSKTHYYTEANESAVTLFDEESGLSASEVLLGEGLARISKRDTRRLRRPDDKSLVAKLQKVQDEAKAAHVGMWRYGEVGDSDDEGAAKGAWGAKRA